MRLGSMVAFGAGIAAALSLTGCQWLQSQHQAWLAVHHKAPPPPPAPTASLGDDSFLAAALARAQSQRALAETAGTKARTASILAYAKGVAAERTGLETRLAAAAQQEGVGSDTNQAPRPDVLDQLTGEQFERAYVAAELEDQQNNLDSFAFEAQNGLVPSVRILAAGELPRLRQDLARAGAIVRDIPFEQESDEAGMTLPAH